MVSWHDIRECMIHWQQLVLTSKSYPQAEVLLVDDLSDMEHLGQRLEDYVAKMPIKVKVLRTPARVGLVQARWD